MSVSGFIPEVWAARLFARLNAALIAAQALVVNRDYEGEISQKGDTVHIGGIGAVTVKPFTRNQDIDTPETLADDMQTLEITEGDYFNFQVDDVDARQAAVGLLDGAIGQAGYDLAAAADAFLLALMASDGTPVVTSETEAYDQLVDMGVQLDEGETPGNDRWAIIPSWFHGKLLKDERFVAAGDLPSSETRLNGQVGAAAGFRILKSNRVAHTSSAYQAIAGHAIATSYAEQINKTEAYRPERRFADAVKGLHLYGAKVTRPLCLAVLDLTRP